VVLAPLCRTTVSLLLFAVPHGGQQAARRNAWACMSADASRARGRRDADAAFLRASRAVAGREQIGTATPVGH
jgi:hypothetical protein